eukprot:6484095-Amphidinium_carterae.2
MEDPGDPVTAEQRLVLAASAESFLAEINGAQSSGAVTSLKEHKPPRLASYKLIAAMDHQWQVSAGFGLSRFMSEASDLELPLCNRPHLAMIMDTAADNMCAASYLLGKGLRMTLVPDPVHKVWRALWKGVKDGGAMTTVFLAGIVCNLERGPWNGAQFFEELKSTAMDVSQLVGCECGLVDLLGPKILQDTGDMGGFDEDRKRELMSELQQADFLNTKSKKVALTRWGTWHDHVDELLGHYHTKLMLLLFLGLLKGWSASDMLGAGALKALSIGKAALLEDRGVQGSGGASASSDAALPVTTKVAGEQMRKLRDGCKNTLAAAAKIMSCPDFHFDLCCISLTSGELREWHATMASVSFKSPSEALRFYAHEAIAGSSSGLMKAMSSMLRPLKKLDALDRMGFITSILGGALEVVKSDDVEFLAEQRKMNRLWRLQCGILGSCIKHFLYLQMYPFRFAKLLRDDVDKHKLLEEFYRDWSAWLAVKELKGPPWTTLLKRSCFTWRVVVEFFEIPLEQQKLEMEVAMGFVRKIFKTQGSTLSTENAFQIKSNTAKQQPNEHVSMVSLWGKPVEQELLSTRFAYKEVKPYEGLDVRAHTVVPGSLFVPVAKRASLDCRDMLRKGVPSWPSYTGLSLNLVAAEMFFLVEAVEKQLTGLATRGWKASFLKENGVVRDEQNRWYFVVALVLPVVCLWPLELITVGQCTVARFAEVCDGLPIKRVACDFTGWMAVSSEWLTPLRCMKVFKKMTLGECPDVSLELVGKPVPLLHFAAQEGFGSLSTSDVKRMIKNEYGTQLDGTLAEVMLQGICIVLGCSEEEATQHLERRLGYLHADAA